MYNSPMFSGRGLAEGAREAAGIVARGFCMGAADLVPGVSGGTVAFIAGIYARLLAALGALSSPPLWRALMGLQIRQVWRAADGGFLTALFFGILTAALTLANLLRYLLATHTHLLLAFFFGLVVAAAFAVARQMRAPKKIHWLAAAAGAILGLAAVLSPATTLPPTPVALFFGGAIAICAMLLPGISGSYLLLIMGLYGPVLAAVGERDIATLLIFAGGCGCGLLMFSRLLSFLLKKYGDGMTAFLIGLMLGAAPKLWPWKQGGEDTRAILRPNILPDGFEGDPQIGLALLFFAGGVLLTAGASALANRRK